MQGKQITVTMMSFPLKFNLSVQSSIPPQLRLDDSTTCVVGGGFQFHGRALGCMAERGWECPKAWDGDERSLCYYNNDVKVICGYYYRE